MAHADSDNDSMDITSRGIAKRYRESTSDASDDYIASSTVVTATANTSAGAAGGQDASTSEVPSVTKSTTKSYMADFGVLEAVVSIGSVGDGNAGKALLTGGRVAHETSVDFQTPAEFLQPILGSGNIVSVSDATAAAAAVVTVTVKPRKRSDVRRPTGPTSALLSCSPV